MIGQVIIIKLKPKRVDASISANEKHAQLKRNTQAPKGKTINVNDVVGRLQHLIITMQRFNFNY